MWGAITNEISAVAITSKDQSNGIEGINDNMGQIGTVVKHNVANANKIAAEAKELAKDAVALRELVGGFILSADGARGPRGLEEPSSAT